MQKLTLSESMEYFVNIKTGFCTCRKIGTALLSCVSMCLLITHCLVCNIRLIPCDHDWDFLRKILFKFRDPLIHLLESVGICAIIDNDGSFYNHWVRIYLRLHDSKPGWVRDIFLVPQCPRSPSWGSSHQPSQLWKESMKQKISDYFSMQVASTVTYCFSLNCPWTNLCVIEVFPTLAISIVKRETYLLRGLRLWQDWSFFPYLRYL